MGWLEELDQRIWAEAEPGRAARCDQREGVPQSLAFQEAPSKQEPTKKLQMLDFKPKPVTRR